ncbi:MAG: hypothetical protein DHS20C18_47720 [Saprospiraceae bacterium]|nr:MAG: hypothetical protein DHS20C18_47720 [Saprospiraceae bacterium]
MKHILLLGISLILLTLSCQEDTIEPQLYGRVIGTTIDDVTFIPLQNTIISTNPSTSVITVEPDGSFAIDSLEPGNYTIKARLDGYLDESVTVSVKPDLTTETTILLSVAPDGNQPPGIPAGISPLDGATDEITNLTMRWTASDPNAGDTLRYDLILYPADGSESLMVAEQIVDTFFQVNNLNFGEIYFWQVIVTDGAHDPVYSPVWQFKTRHFPDARIHFSRRVDDQYQVFGFTDIDSTILIVDGPMNFWRPRVDPSRERIAFLSIKALETHLFITDREGAQVNQVTSVPVVTYDNQNTGYCWSPDGARLLYANNNLLYAVNADGTGLTIVSQAPPGQRFAEVDWNQNTNKILARTVENFHYQSRLYLVDLDGSIQPLLDSIPGSYSSPSFSIDGSRILYCHDVTNFPSPDGRQLDARIFLLDLQTNQSTDISYDKVAGTNDLQARFSPTDAVLIFVNTQNDGVSPKDIWTMKISGLDREPIIQNGEMPDWR